MIKVIRIMAIGFWLYFFSMQPAFSDQNCIVIYKITSGGRNLFNPPKINYNKLEFTINNSYDNCQEAAIKILENQGYSRDMIQIKAVNIK